jgi:D-alanyl-D-alanine carboxypeptidase
MRPVNAFRLSLAALACASALSAQQPGGTGLVRTIDSIAMAPIDAHRAAGMSVAVVRGADTIVLKGYGYADLELKTPTPDDAVYEIGSVTKQFTAAAVFQLRDRGLLSLDDDLTKYLPSYPEQGHHVTIRRLLNHTSGIKGYTEMPEFWTRLVARVQPRDSLVALFSHEPFDFAPGEEMIYNNSAYFLLGLIIEKASGESYPDYIQHHLFDPVGMTHSRYCPDFTLMPGRVQGYEMGDSGLQRAHYLTQTWPFAAGSLCSTARDLVKWMHALHGDHATGGTVLPAATYREYMTPGTLNDATPLRYANGLEILTRHGRRVIMHGGGIFGFLTDERYYPDEDLSIVVLINTAGPVDPASVADGIENAVLGKPPEEPRQTFAGDLSQFVGTYHGPGRGQTLDATVAVDSLGLALTMPGGSTQHLHYVDGLTFGAGIALYHFVRQGNAIVQLRADQGGGYYILNRTK